MVACQPLSGLALNGLANFGGHLGLPSAEMEGRDPKRIVEPLRRFIRSGKCGFGVCRDGGGDGVLDACEGVRQLRRWDTRDLRRVVGGGVIVDQPGGWSVSRSEALNASCSAGPAGW